MASLHDHATSLLTPDIVRRAAGALNVPATGMDKALGAAVSTVLGTMAVRDGDDAFLAELTQLVGRASIAGSPEEAATGVLESMEGIGEHPLLAMGRRIVATLFGASADAVAGMLGRLAGASDSGTEIVALAGALSLSLLSAQVPGARPDSVTLAAVLRTARGSFQHAMPGAIAGLLRISQFVDDTGSRTVPTPPFTPTVSRTPLATRATEAPGARSTLPFVAGLIIGLAVLGWMYLQRHPLRAAPRSATPPAAERGP